MRRARSLLLLCFSTVTAGVSSACAQGGSAIETGQAQTQATLQPAPKKVWTNSDLEHLRADSPVSTIGKASAAPAAAARSNPAAHKDARAYSDQIAKLEAQLPPIRRKIAQLEAGLSGQPTGDSKTSTRPRYASLGDWPAELAQLQKRREDIEERINALRDQARQAGIWPNSLP